MIYSAEPRVWNSNYFGYHDAVHSLRYKGIAALTTPQAPGDFFQISVLVLAQWIYSFVAQLKYTSFTSFQLSPSPDEAPSGGTAEKKQAECQRDESLSSAWMKSAEYLKAANRSSLAWHAQPLCCTAAAKHLLMESFRGSAGSSKARKPHPVLLSNPWQGIHTAGLCGLPSHGCEQQGCWWRAQIQTQRWAKDTCKIQVCAVSGNVHAHRDTVLKRAIILVSIWWIKKKRTRLIKQFHFYKMYWEAWPSSQ